MDTSEPTKSSNGGHNNDTPRPLLREVEAFPVEAQDGYSLALRDPEGLTSDVLIVPRGLLPILALFDGKHDVDAILVEIGRPDDDEVRARIEEAIASLDEKLFLEGPRVEQARARVEREFRESPTRPAVHAGAAYDAEPAKLAETLDSFYKDAPAPDASKPLKGLIAPHIDYRRGGPCYGYAYREIAAREGADVYVILGTCHAGLRSPFSATLKAYDTPFGPAETDAAFVRALAERSGLDLFSQELAHRGEHSIELQAVFLKHAQPKGRPFTIVPILASYCHELLAQGKKPRDSDEVRRFLDALREELARPGRTVCVVAGADLAHMGTRFGDGALAKERLPEIEREDLAALAKAEAVDPDGFFAEIARDGDRRRICGYSPIHGLLSALSGNASGRLLKYGQWPDPDGTVTFASLAFT